jgi:hypothetical protein
MLNGYTQSPRLLKGALIQFSAPLLVPVPNIITFQYNPETLTRTLSPWKEPAANEEGRIILSPSQYYQLTQPYDPEEDFSVALELDATDALEEPDAHPLAERTGVAGRIAALEMLCYPPKDGGLLNIPVDVSLGAGGANTPLGNIERAHLIPRLTVPVVLFFWGPGRIVPVRITGLSIEEQFFSPTLYPIRAKVTITMKVLTEGAFDNQEETATVKIAKAAYTFTRTQKEVLASADTGLRDLLNLVNTGEAISGLLPF